MPASSDEYVQRASSGDDDDDLEMLEASGPPAGSSRQGHGHSSSARRGKTNKAKDGKRRGAAKEAWAMTAEERNRKLGGAVPGQQGNRDTAEDLGRKLEARKRARLRQDTQPFQRGIIRHVVLILDMSECMLEKDFRPNRHLAVLHDTESYILEFFEQNPISQLSILIMHDGLCLKITDLSGNPQDHLTALASLRRGKNDEPSHPPKGSPSLQNALDMARAMLYHTPRHGTREVLVILGALLSNDPGDIHDAIRAARRARLQIAVVGLFARLKICDDMVAATNAGNSSSYAVATDQAHFRECLMATTVPPVVRTSGAVPGPEAVGADDDNDPSAASLLLMGFPSRMHSAEDAASLCACHGERGRAGYACPRCKAKVCGLPATCPACGLTLILSTHLARSYHHLFPLRNWETVSWRRAREMGSVACVACLRVFPAVPREGKGEEGDREGSGRDIRKGDEVSESGRYECGACHKHFCVDCEVFVHEVLHNCPGCLSGPPAEPLEEEELRSRRLAEEMMNKRKGKQKVALRLGGVRVAVNGEEERMDLDP